MKPTRRICITTRHQHGCEPDLEGTIPARSTCVIGQYIDDSITPCTHHPNCEVLDYFENPTDSERR